jgi:hypothetical protein
MTEDTSKTPRRAVLASGLGLVAAGCALTATAHAQNLAQEKLAQDLVQYQASPKDGNQCGKCAQFQPPNGCAIVTSPVAPAGWCVAFTPKEG